MEYSALERAGNQILHFIDETHLEGFTFTQPISSKLQMRNRISPHLVIFPFYCLNFSSGKVIFLQLQSFWLAWGRANFGTESKSHFPGKLDAWSPYDIHLRHFFLFLSLLLTHTFVGWSPEVSVSCMVFAFFLSCTVLQSTDCTA